MTTGKSEQPISPEGERTSEGGGAPARAKASASPSTPTTSHLLLNRELSLLEFNRRVLEEALDRSQPLLERVKFLSIFASNTDEFFMIRVSGLKEEVEADIKELSPDGLSPAQQLNAVREHMLPMFDEQARCLRDDIIPELRKQGIEIVSYQSLADYERRTLNDYFEKHIYPVLTPQAVDPAHPFPSIQNLSLNLGLMVQPLPEHGITSSLTGKVAPRFARVQIPPKVRRLVPVEEGGTRFVFAADVIAANVHSLFPRMHAGPSYLFRVTRDADVDIREDEARDLLHMMQQTLRKRRLGEPVRLEVTPGMPAEMVRYLTESLGLDAEDVYVGEGLLNVPDLMELYKLDRPDLKDKPIKATLPATLRGVGATSAIFDRIKQQDILLHHPYTSFGAVTDFIAAAARDPEVQAIKMCLYRTGARSPIPEALIEASEQGKQVTAIVELKARFDEENNIEWAQRLEDAGVHVVYGLLGLKTHCKLTLVIRREGDDLRRYMHIATGNYNPVTSTVYTDLGLLTADEQIGADATDLFNFLTGYSRQKEYRELMVAPVNLRQRMIALVEREAEHARAGRPARMVAKINRLADVQMVHTLYNASQAGVEIDMIIRGICMLRPGVPGLSESIRVRSIVGRFLEHSRVYYFANGGDEEVYTGSADLMSRNLSRRVEVLAPVKDPRLKKYLKDVVLASYLRDNTKARVLRSDGSYERVEIADGDEPFDAQMNFDGSASV
ncbi:MAG TPA: polyphosphate kinase 1 [Pyrinomonadaceae bacterium]|nr:polyphosphate kinase 1 [Pyrinomonadaceae bacterium]